MLFQYKFNVFIFTKLTYNNHYPGLLIQLKYLHLYIV